MRAVLLVLVLTACAPLCGARGVYCTSSGRCCTHPLHCCYGACCDDAGVAVEAQWGPQ